MQDHISRLPAPLPLYILLELSDLKALYAAILSSPHLYATFRLNAHHIFGTIARGTLAPEINTAIQTYIHLHENLFGQPDQGLQQTLQERLQTAVQDHTDYSSVRYSASTVFHVLAQAVRLHDIGVSILKSKLEYLTTLRPQKLADPEFRYRRETVMEQRPHGTELILPDILRELSWPEENRMLWALWVLDIARLASDRLSNYSCRTALVDITQALLEYDWTETLMTEVRECLRSGTSLRTPISTRNTEVQNSPDDLNILRPYEIPHPPYTTISLTISKTIPNTPVYQWFSAPGPTPNIMRWGHFDAVLSHQNPAARYVRAMGNRPQSPLQPSEVHVFDRLGFCFWDHRRISNDLQLRVAPPVHLVRPKAAYFDAPDAPIQLSESDFLFRLYSFFKHEDEREQSGWKRG
jgi:hypothetical protein